MTSVLQTIHELRSLGASWSQVANATGLTLEAARAQYKRWRYRRVDATAEHPPAPAPAPTHVPPLFPDWQVPERPHWTEWLDLFDHVNKLFVRSNSYIEKLTIQFDTSEPIAVASASDLHLGGGFTNHRELRATLEYVLETPGLYLGVCGDSIEGFLPGLHGAETTEQMAGSVGAQMFALESLVDDLTAAGKLLYWTWGDHDAKWFEDRVGLNVIKLLIDRKVPYFPGRGLTRFQLNGQEYFWHINHAERYRSLLNATHPQRRMYDLYFPADVTIAGHLHKPAYHVEHFYDVARELGLPFGGKAIFIQNGTFKTGPDVYTIRSWTRGIIGVPTVVLYPDRHDMDVFDSPLKAMQFVGNLREHAAPKVVKEAK